MLAHIPFPALPVPPSWFPGHMLQFQRSLPAVLRKTDVVLELRDARLPLTSINRNFEGEPPVPPSRGASPVSSFRCLAASFFGLIFLDVGGGVCVNAVAEAPPSQERQCASPPSAPQTLSIGRRDDIMRRRQTIIRLTLVSLSI